MVRIVLTVVTVLLASCSWAEPLEKPNVTYEKRPSGRVYGSDGSVYDKLPTGKVYDSQGKAYGAKPQSIGNANNLPKALPRANTSGMPAGNLRSGTPRR